MSTKFGKIVQNFGEVLSMKPKKTESYDTVATIKRIDGNTAWVEIPGGYYQTPVKKTINAKEGDVVQIRIGGGQGWIVGNASAPPTDDTTANGAVKLGNNNSKSIKKLGIRLDQAEKDIDNLEEDMDAVEEVADSSLEIATATAQHFWTDDDGLHIASGSDNPTADRNALWNSLGMLFRKAANNVLAILTGSSPGVAIYDGSGNTDDHITAFFGSTARIGKSASAHVETSSSGVGVHNSSGTKVADFGSEVVLGIPSGSNQNINIDPDDGVLFRKGSTTYASIYSTVISNNSNGLIMEAKTSTKIAYMGVGQNAAAAMTVIDNNSGKNSLINLLPTTMDIWCDGTINIGAGTKVVITSMTSGSVTSALGFTPSKRFKRVWKSTDNFNLPADSTKECYITVDNENGYIPIGVVGYDMNAGSSHNGQGSNPNDHNLKKAVPIAARIIDDNGTTKGLMQLANRDTNDPCYIKCMLHVLYIEDV